MTGPTPLPSRDPKDHAPPATAPARTARQHTRDAAKLHGIIDEMRAKAPSHLYPLLQVAQSMLDSKDEA